MEISNIYSNSIKKYQLAVSRIIHKIIALRGVKMNITFSFT